MWTNTIPTNIYKQKKKIINIKYTKKKYKQIYTTNKKKPKTNFTTMGCQQVREKQE